VGHGRTESAQAADSHFIAWVVERWRGATSNDKGDFDDSPPYDIMVSDEFSPLQQALARSQERGGVGARGTPVARPDSFFFPFDDTVGGRPGSRSRR